MKESRSSFTVAIDDQIFAIDGWGNKSSVEVLKLGEKEWKYCKSMEKDRKGHAVSVGNLENEKSFYVFGGETEDREYSNEVLKYNITTKKWMEIRMLFS